MEACAISSPTDTPVVTLRVCGWGNWRILSFSPTTLPPPPSREAAGCGFTLQRKCCRKHCTGSLKCMPLQSSKISLKSVRIRDKNVQKVHILASRGSIYGLFVIQIAVLLLSGLSAKPFCWFQWKGCRVYMVKVYQENPCSYRCVPPALVFIYLD